MGLTRRMRHLAGWLGALGSLALLGAVLLAYPGRCDPLAAMAVMPVWLWGLHGLALQAVARWAVPARVAWLGIALWIAVSIGLADESHALRNGSCAPLTPDRSAAGTLRVVTFNAAQCGHGDPTRDLARWHPDVLLLQEIPAHRLRHLASELFGQQAHWLAHRGNGVASRWPLQAAPRRPGRTLQTICQEVSLARPGEKPLHLVNLHLPSATTDLRLWEPACWRRHLDGRRHRVAEMEQILSSLDPHPEGPILLGGDFNAVPWDPVHDLLGARFRDAFHDAGRGWGNTFHRRLPLLRLDQLHAGPSLDVQSCRAVRTRHSDHRFVVADFLLK